MARQLTRPVKVTLKDADLNRWQIPTFIEEAGPRLVVHLNGMLRTETPSTRRIPNPDFDADALAAADPENPYEVERWVDESFMDVRDANLSNLDPEIFTGEALDALYAAGHENACALIKTGMARGTAARRGLRDAMYAALEQRGRIPADQ